MTNHTTAPLASKKMSLERQKRHHVSTMEAEEDKHILADRYKTKMCKNYVAKGECPYEVRCMFAHGEKELRTSTDNIRDGLITEEAIKTFQRQQNQAKRRAAYAAVRDESERAVSAAPHCEVEAEREDAYFRCAPVQPAAVPQFVPSAETREHAGGFFAHNPYAFNLIPAEAREFPAFEEEAYWYEEQPAAAEEDYYFPSSELMAPLMPIFATQPAYAAQQGSKMYQSHSSATFSDEAAYGQSESSGYFAYRGGAHCTAAEMPSYAEEAPMVLEP